MAVGENALTSIQKPGEPVAGGFAIDTDDPIYNEQFRALRAKVEQQVDARNLKVVAVSSAVAGEGKTLTCRNLAVNLAGPGRKRILVVDADLRKSDLARLLGIRSSPGLTEFLLGSAEIKEVIRNSAVPGLHVVPAGARVANPVDILTGEKFRRLLQLLREQFDVILLDTPPLLPVADTLALRGMVDGFVLLFRAGFTPHTLFQQAIDEIVGSFILGVVLNGVETRGEKYYQRYYGKYYRKGGDGNHRP